MPHVVPTSYACLPRYIYKKTDMLILFCVGVDSYVIQLCQYVYIVVFWYSYILRASIEVFMHCAAGHQPRLPLKRRWEAAADVKLSGVRRVTGWWGIGEWFINGLTVIYPGLARIHHVELWFIIVNRNLRDVHRIVCLLVLIHNDIAGQFVVHSESLENMI